MFKKIILVLVVTIISAGIILGVMIFASRKSAEQTAEEIAKYQSIADILIEPTEEVRNFEISSEIIPKLESHSHYPGDSAYDPNHHLLVDFPSFVFTEDTWLMGASLNVTNAPNQIIHHASPIASNIPSRICAQKGLGKMIFGMGYDVSHHSLSLPEDYAVFIPAGTFFNVDLMVHNPEPPVGPGELYENVQVLLYFNIQKAIDGNKGKKVVEPFNLFLADEFCSAEIHDYVFEIPPYSEKFIKDKNFGKDNNGYFYKFNESGYIVYAYGHLHGWDGAKKIEIFKNDELIDTLETFRFGSEDEPWLWETERSGKKIRVEKGDVISVAATYSNPYSTSVRGAMADYFFFFAPD